MARAESARLPRRFPSQARDGASEATSHCGAVRPSKRGRWRALSLILVYAAVAAHVVHWKLTGRTLTPVEPSEAMQTLGQGLVNAGFVLFALLIVSTLVFGRFFCGWACHIVALQDLCTWFLRRIGVRPRPFRSRLLVYVPILAAAWMFVVPSVVRAVMQTQHPAMRAAFFTDDLWGRFPGPWVAGLTFVVCGFLIVYLLGNKGFCTYGCPYGGVFGLADQVAPGKIRVSDACDGCGHCTATCTSNVRVHEEVKLYRMVVDPGCMKCMDCIDVCPKDALSYGFGAPSAAKGAPRAKKANRTYDFTMREEVAMAGLFLISIAILRALYDAVPFLLALGLASISAYTLLTAFRLRKSSELRWSRYALRSRGSTTPAGKVFLAAAALWTLFLAHSGFVQYYALVGARRLQAARERFGATEPATDPVRRAAFEASRAPLLRAAALGLFASGPLEARIASASQEMGDDATAEVHYRRATQIAGDIANAHLALARYARARGDTSAAIAEYASVVRLDPSLENAPGDLAELLLAKSRGSEALDMMNRQVARRPGEVTLRLKRALVLAQTGDMEGGLRETQEIATAQPMNPDAIYQLGRMFASQRRMDEAFAALERASQLAPNSVEVHWWCAKVAVADAKLPAARTHLEAARRQAPYDVSLARAWAALLQRSGGLDAAIAGLQARSASDRGARFALLYLYRAAGRDRDADSLAGEFPEAARYGAPASTTPTQAR